MVYVTEITSENYDEKIASNDVVMVDIWAPWCGPCKILSPTVDEVASELGSKVLVGKMNADENMDFCATLGIRSIPTLLFYKGGKLQEKKVGALSKADIISVLNGLVDVTKAEDSF